MTSMTYFAERYTMEHLRMQILRVDYPSTYARLVQSARGDNVLTPEDIRVLSGWTVTDRGGNILPEIHRVVEALVEPDGTLKPLRQEQLPT